ncbi:unnamed protein product [Haemonchus placei]|uniref:N-acetyltransferase domain-containing protein n=1 Tax=Haemonchus placei TaxID=6290 RepID=A0A158QM43_HAEPC|nr:unnamed protein product [Haemonchus placei]
MTDDNYDYRIATSADRQRILDFLLEHFYKEEPLCRASKMSKEELLKVVSHIVDISLKDPFSTIVTCKSTFYAKLVDYVYFSLHTNLFSGAILNELHNSFFDLVPDHVKTVLHREISSVGKPYQRQGIATKMMNFSFSYEKLQYGIDGIMSETSSFANQKLLARYGFKRLKVIRLSDWRDSNGRPLLQPDDGTEEAVLNWKPVEELVFIDHYHLSLGYCLFGSLFNSSNDSSTKK